MTVEHHWKLNDIPWHRIERRRMKDDEALFYMVSSASLIEITTDRYTRNLVRHFADDREVAEWLAQGWEPEELQHGRALRRYAQCAWPDFDWEAVYAAFLAEYGPLCQPESLFPQRSLELVARCVVEMGTSSYYTALRDACGEPVLAQLAQHIFEDEVGHYKHFYKYFLRYRDIEGVSRMQIARASWRRLMMVGNEDSYIALKHVHAARHPDQPFDRQVYKRLVKSCRQLAGEHFPHRMSVKMLLKPLDMAPLAQRIVQPVAESVARYAVV